MSRAVAAVIVLLALWVLMHRRRRGKKPLCHPIYGCNNSPPDYAYWSPYNTFSLSQ